tara:strand:- start:188 stop:445 length:258 start_codon:yes stop_codon:yes gene_type:complete
MGIVRNSNKFIERVRSAVAEGKAGGDSITESSFSESNDSVRKRVSAILADAELAWETMFKIYTLLLRRQDGMFLGCRALKIFWPT